MRISRRLIFLVAALIAVMALAAPAVAQAASGRGFSASAEVVVTDPGVSIPVGKNKIRTWGEIIEGAFTSVVYEECTDCDLLHLLGAPLKVRHNSVITLDDPDPETGIGGFTGRARAFFTVRTSTGTLFGIYRATLTGEYHIQDGQLVIRWVIDEGKWKALGRVLDDGGFVKAKGDWSAALNLTLVPVDGGSVYTLAGVANIAGTYEPIGNPRR